MRTALPLLLNAWSCFSSWGILRWPRYIPYDSSFGSLPCVLKLAGSDTAALKYGAITLVKWGEVTSQGLGALREGVMKESMWRSLWWSVPSNEGAALPQQPARTTDHWEWQLMQQHIHTCSHQCCLAESPHLHKILQSQRWREIEWTCWHRSYFVFMVLLA